MKKRTLWSLLSLLIIVSMLAVACGGEEATSTPKPEPTEAPEAEPTEPPAAEGSYLDRAFAGEFEGTVVTAFGPFTDEDAVKFDATMAEFEAQTGIDVQYEGRKSSRRRFRSA